jgi:hypothetical protein
MEVQSIDIPPGNSFRLTPVDLDAEVIDFQFSLDMLMTIKVQNTNRYALKIEQIDLSVS